MLMQAWFWSACIGFPRTIGEHMSGVSFGGIVGCTETPIMIISRLSCRSKNQGRLVLSPKLKP